MKRYFKTIRYMDLCLLWGFEVPVIGKRLLTADTILYVRVRKNGNLHKNESYVVKLEANDECIGHYAKIMYK